VEGREDLCGLCIAWAVLWCFVGRCEAWAVVWCFVGLWFFDVVLAFASVTITATVGRARPKDARRCLRVKFTAGSTEGKGFRDQANNV
jgi:hypothetical protein